MRILLLGGTSDARQIASALIDEEHHIIYSVAGLVRKPNLDCEIISGGFKIRGGLAHYLTEQAIDLVVDATHPYAQQMTITAAHCCHHLGLAYYRFDRPPWSVANHWREFNDLTVMIEALVEVDCVLVTTGQLTQQQLDRISCLCKHVVYRTAAAPVAQLASNIKWIKAIGPFDLAAERALIEDNRVDVLLSKNAGGDATCAKLEAARQLGVSVFMLQRPPVYLSENALCFVKVDALLAALSLHSHQ